MTALSPQTASEGPQGFGVVHTNPREDRYPGVGRSSRFAGDPGGSRSCVSNWLATPASASWSDASRSFLQRGVSVSSTSRPDRYVAEVSNRRHRTWWNQALAGDLRLDRSPRAARREPPGWNRRAVLIMAEIAARSTPRPLPDIKILHAGSRAEASDDPTSRLERPWPRRRARGRADGGGSFGKRRALSRDSSVAAAPPPSGQSPRLSGSGHRASPVPMRTHAPLPS